MASCIHSSLLTEHTAVLFLIRGPFLILLQFPVDSVLLEYVPVQSDTQNLLFPLLNPLETSDSNTIDNQQYSPSQVYKLHCISILATSIPISQSWLLIFACHHKCVLVVCGQSLTRTQGQTHTDRTSHMPILKLGLYSLFENNVSLRLLSFWMHMTQPSTCHAVVAEGQHPVLLVLHHLLSLFCS